MKTMDHLNVKLLLGCREVKSLNVWEMNASPGRTTPKAFILDVVVSRFLNEASAIEKQSKDADRQ